MSILWFPILFTVLLPVIAQVALQQARPHKVHGPLAAPGDGGAGIFFFVFPLMMAGVITTVVLLRRSTWGIGRRVVLMAGVGAVASLAAYFPAVGLHVLPGQPLLLVCAFLLTQLAGVQSIVEGDGVASRSPASTGFPTSSVPR